MMEIKPFFDMLWDSDASDPHCNHIKGTLCNLLDLTVAETENMLLKSSSTQKCGVCSGLSKNGFGWRLNAFESCIWCL